MGIEIGKLELNLNKMMENKDKAVSTLTKGIEFLFKKNKVSYIKGKGKLISLIQDGNDYKQWSAYWGCAACNGSTLAAEAWKIKP